MSITHLCVSGLGHTLHISWSFYEYRAFPLVGGIFNLPAQSLPAFPSPYLTFFSWLASPNRLARLDGFPGRSAVPLCLGVLTPVAPINCFRSWRRMRCSWREMSDSSGADQSVMPWFARLNQKYQTVLMCCWDFQSRFPTSCRQSLGTEEDTCAKHREPCGSWCCLLVSESLPSHRGLSKPSLKCWMESCYCSVKNT